MPQIILIQSPRLLKSFLKEVSFDNRKNYRYLNLGIEFSDTLELFKKVNIEKVEEPTIDRDQFLGEYLNLVGILNSEYQSHLWFATDLSSKNRFTSQLPMLLQKFLVAIEVAQKKNYERLVICNIPWQIISSLKKKLESENLSYLCLEDKFECLRELLCAFIRRVGSVFVDLMLVMKNKLHTMFYLKAFRSKQTEYYVIKTFIYDHSFSKEGKYQDVFFGPLPDFLNGKKNVFILANVLGNYRLCLKKMKDCNSFPIFPLESFCTFFDILCEFLRVLFYRVQINKHISFFNCDVREIVINELKRTFYKIQPYQFLHHRCIEGLIKIVPIETFLLTYENNPWERMCTMALRHYSPSTKIVGYQHTVIPQASANMFPSQREEAVIPLPDRILTVGEAPKKIIERYGHYKKGVIEPACALRYEYLSCAPTLERKHSKQILVALEGIFEVYHMVNYVLEELKDRMDYQVAIRTHPVLPFKSFAHKLTYRLDSHPHFHLSKKSLREDIEWADMVIYWGSTVALEAISMGRPVISFDMGLALNYDPLFECPDFKRTISRQKSLISAIEEFYALNPERFYEEQRRAKDYMKKYFYPVSEQNLQKFLP